MKEETKKKLCKISKIVGFAITFGFAVFGVLCAAVLISNGSKKDDIKTLDSSLVQNEVRSERISKPRKAPDYVGGVNILEDPDMSYKRDYSNFVLSSPFTISFGGQGANDSIALTDKLPKGYYYVSTDNPWFALRDYTYFNSIKVRIQNNGNDTFVIADNQYNADFAPYLSYSGGYFYADGDTYFFGRSQGTEIYLVDTLQLPATSSVYLGENWNPLKAFGDTLSEKGGFLLTDESWTANSSSYKNLSISGLLFKYQGVVYDRIYMIARPLNSSAYPYVDSSGAIVERAITQNSGPNEIYVLDYVGFGQSWLYDGLLPSRGLLKVMVGGKADTPSPGGKLPYNGSLQWVTSSRTIQIIDNKGTTTGRYENRFSYMTDLEFINMLAQYESEAVDVVNNGQMFGLFTNAFESLLPILSISILPNITLGMLLFIPLIGAIIVIVIRVVKK